MKNFSAAFVISTALLFHAAGSLHAAAHDKAHAEAWAAVKHAIAVLHPTEGNQCRGTVQFTEQGDSVKIIARIEGLNPGQKHAFHIHEFGDCSAADATSAGGHYNPEGHMHGLPDTGGPGTGERHAGDLGNLQADSQGRARLEITVKNISIAGTRNPVIGRGVIVHAKPDDGGQPVGNAGARIGCGVIGVAKAPEKQ